MRRPALETMLQSLNKQERFYSLAHEHILQLLKERKDESYDDEETEGEQQVYLTRDLQVTLADLLVAWDAINKV